MLTSLDISPIPKLLLLYRKQSRVKNAVDEQPLSLAVWLKVSGYKAAFTPVHLIFLELKKHHYHLDYKVLDENNNEIFQKTFCLQLLNEKL